MTNAPNIVEWHKTILKNGAFSIKAFQICALEGAPFDFYNEKYLSVALHKCF